MAITFEILNQTQGKQREVLIAFSKELRVANTDQGRGITDRIWAGLTGDADLKYLEEKQNADGRYTIKTNVSLYESHTQLIIKVLTAGGTAKNGKVRDLCHRMQTQGINDMHRCIQK